MTERIALNGPGVFVVSGSLTMLPSGAERIASRCGAWIYRGKDKAASACSPDVSKRPIVTEPEALSRETWKE